MDFTNLPYDTQKCPIKMKVAVELREVEAGFLDPPAKITQGYDPAGEVEWNILDITGKNTSGVFGCSSGKCKGLTWELDLERIPDYYSNYILLPSRLMVTISWGSFFVSRAAAPARVAMTIICFLTVTSLINTVLSSLPRGKGHVWLLQHLTISQCFIFFSVIEYAFANFLSRIESRLNKTRERCLSDRASVAACEESGQAGLEPMQPESSIQIMVRQKGGLGERLCVNSKGGMKINDQRLDILSRLLYPVVYAIIVSLHYALR